MTKINKPSITKELDYAKSILTDEVFSLFSDEIKRNFLYPYYDRYLVTLKAILPHLIGNKKVKILDVGTGGGVIPLVLRKMGYPVTAIDTWEEYSETSCDMNTVGTKGDIIERLDRHGVQTKYCDIEKEPFPFEDQSFGIVLFLAVIEHLHSSPKKVLKEIKRVLAPNGILVLETPNHATLRNRLYLLFGKSVETELSYWFNREPFFGHVREYTPDEAKKMLAWTGFEVKRVNLDDNPHTSLIKDFKSKPLKLIILLIYLLITTLVPKFRYQMIIVGRKKLDESISGLSLQK